MLTPNDLKLIDKILQERDILIRRRTNLETLRDDVPDDVKLSVSINCSTMIKGSYFNNFDLPMTDMPQRDRIIDILHSVIMAELKLIDAKLAAFGIAPDGKAPTPLTRKGPKLRLA